jgi:serine O-acetyltransferase
MSLDNWLSENLIKISAVLAENNREYFVRRGVLNNTTRNKVIEILKSLRSLILPGIYENKPVNYDELENVINKRITCAASELCNTVKGILVHECSGNEDTDECTEIAEGITIKVLEGLPEIRSLLDKDIKAAYNGDPAAKSYEEVILSYPSIEAISIYRIAHLFYNLNVPIIPRIMTEYAHKNTGIDIHPGAAIGSSFFIDHGTGVVIGETCTIGNNVKLYQGITLGAKSFPLDEHGNPIKGVKRHPDVEDNVIIYSGATILGGNTIIGHDSVIGGNVWLTDSIPPYSTVFNSSPQPAIKTLSDFR